ncbi:unnamed protein product [Adineta ricciae]|uniref:phosphoinositide 5-phosphatase n=1 Tax=Adineta ricciae TaxID=249248 RepID=A0A813QHK0_ADIRI|nr:unnamed protein product [Adineta ricciae]CAF1205051.1 unnamed protein product [Adineta ricciae]
MFPNAAPTRPTRSPLPAASLVTNWNVVLYRKAESIHPSHSHDPSQIVSGSFYIQLQQQACSTSPSRSDVLCLRYQSQHQKNTIDSYALPFTITQLSDVNLSPDSVPLSSTLSSATSSKFYNGDQQNVRINAPSDSPFSLLLRAKAFLGILVLNNSTNSTTANTAGIIRPFMIFVTEDVCIGQLFDAYIFRIIQVATISIRDNPEDEVYVAGIRKLFQGRCFYYSTDVKHESNTNRRYFSKPYDITLCAQRMVQGHDSDIRFFWNRGLCLPFLKYNIDIRYWIPKVMCGGIEKYRSQSDEIDMWLISRLSCERAGTRFNVRGVNDDGAVANFVETEQIVLLHRQLNYSSFVIVRGSIPLFWHQPRLQVGTHRITISRSEALSFKAFFEHFKHLYRHYGRVLILNLVEQRDNEKRVGEEYQNLFRLLVKTYQQAQQSHRPCLGHLTERDFIWFDYHEQFRTIKNFTPEQFVRKMLIENSQLNIEHALEQQSVFTYMDNTSLSLQQGIFRINCIDCLDRTNNVQLTIGLRILSMQLRSLRKQINFNNIFDQLKDMWINNGDHISRIYTGTGALGQRSIAKDIQRSVGRAIQNNLRDDEKQQSMQTLIYTYAKDSYLHERSVAALSTPYVIADGLILSEMFKIRQSYIRKEEIRIAVGTWNINGDKNRELDHEYPSILDAWILDGPENMSANLRKANAIETKGYVVNDYKKAKPSILAIGFQEICDLTATNMVWQSSVNATRWVDNVQNYFRKAYPNDEYILLGNDQLVGVCLVIFIRRDLAPFVKNIAVDSVKTGMGGKLGNKGCVAIRLVLHNTSICFICAHFTAGQNEYNERNKDYRSMMEKLSFPPPSRALWHDHIFFLGDFNYRLTISRNQVEYLVRNESYAQLLEYDQLKKEHSENRVFQEFREGPIQFPPTYKYDIDSDNYDTSEKARTPSYTDRILWRSISSDVQCKQLYYGRAEVKTSDHRPVSSVFDAEIEICDEARMHQEYVNIYRRLAPSNAVIIYDMRADLTQRKSFLIEEFDSYVKRKYGSHIPIIDRFFISNPRCLSLHMFFESGDHARRAMEPREDQLPSGVYFSKRLVNLNEDFALAQKLNLLFADADETMYAESTAYDLGVYQQPAREALSTVQDVTVAGVARSLSDFLIFQTMEDKCDASKLTFSEQLKMLKFSNEDSLSHSSAEFIGIEDDMQDFEIMKDVEHTYEQNRRSFGKVIISDSDEAECESLESLDNDNTTSDTKRHGLGPVKLYFKEQLGTRPMYYYRQMKRSRMKKHGFPINYGSIHTKEIKFSLKSEKTQRKQEENGVTNLLNMMEDLPKSMAFVSLDAQHPVVSNSIEQKQKKSRIDKMKAKVKQSLHPSKKGENTLPVNKGHVVTTNFEAIVNEESVPSSGQEIETYQEEEKVNELISFDSDHSKSNNKNLFEPADNVLFNENAFDPFHFGSKSVSNTSKTNGDDLLSFDHHPPPTKSTFYIDPFEIVSKPIPLSPQIHPMTLANNKNPSNQSSFYYQPPPQFIPTRPAPPVPRPLAPPPPPSVQRPLTLDNLSLNSNPFTNNIPSNDLLDLGDPGSPPPSPKFDPYG